MDFIFHYLRHGLIYDRPDSNHNLHQWFLHEKNSGIEYLIHEEAIEQIIENGVNHARRECANTIGKNMQPRGFEIEFTCRICEQTVKQQVPIPRSRDELESRLPWTIEDTCKACKSFEEDLKWKRKIRENIGFLSNEQIYHACALIFGGGETREISDNNEYKKPRTVMVNRKYLQGLIQGEKC